METPLHIVGRVLCPAGAAERVEAFVAHVRRERGVVLSKDTQGACFVRFNAPDLRLIEVARAAARAAAPAQLRFGFALGARDGEPQPGEGTGDAAQVSRRSIEQAGELASGARDGEVLVSPPLAVALIEAGMALHSRQLRLPDGRTIAACTVDASRTREQSAEALGSVYRSLTTQAGEVARKQDLLEARLDAALGKMAVVDRGSALAAHLGELEAELDAQLLRVHKRLRFIDQLELRVAALDQTAARAERQAAELLARESDAARVQSVCDELVTRSTGLQHQLETLAALQQPLLPLAEQVRALESSLEGTRRSVADHEQQLAERHALLESRRKAVEEVQARANAIAHMLGDVNVQLEMLSEQRAAVDHMGEKLARLDFTVQEAQNTLLALQREREVAERVEQGIKSLRQRGGIGRIA